MRPFVRIVLINYDGGDVTLRCLQSLHNLSYPQDRLEIVMVDNASVDGVVWKVRKNFPQVRIVESLTNEGFARGNNLAFADLDNVDVVALINNDAIATKDWLTELISPLSADESIGITTSKMLFNREVSGLLLEPLEAPICISGVMVDGCDTWHEVEFDERWSSRLTGAQAPDGIRSERVKWASHDASFSISRLPSFLPHTLSVHLSSLSQTKTIISGIDTSREMVVGTEPTWFEFEIKQPCHAINSAGGGIFGGFHGGDIGFKELDLGQFDTPRDVFSFCGGATAIRKTVLTEVGGFDPTFFLYYEDLDLSWRAHYRGWRIRYVPTAVVYHEHAYSSGEWSPFFRFWVDRNRRLTLIKNAPAQVALKAFLGAVVWGIRDAFLPIARSCIRLRRPDWRTARYRIRQLGSFLKAVPAGYSFRRRQLKNCALSTSFVYDWISTRLDAEGQRSHEEENRWEGTTNSHS